MLTTWDVIVRLLLSTVLAGLIGLERESLHRPAGFRTHILVCTGSTLTMLLSFYLFDLFAGKTTADPARLGAQVISGIGFLGAGTILKEGLTIKGLTTAASLWAVACIGLAVGAGFYTGAIIATLLVFFTLISLGRLEKVYLHKKYYENICIVTVNKPGQLGKIGAIFGKHNVLIKDLSFIESDDSTTKMCFIISLTPLNNLNEIKAELMAIEGILKVE